MIIGLTGTLASGKDTAADYLKKKSFSHVSLSDLVRDECDLKGLPKDRDTLQMVANDLRKKFGSNILAKKALEKIIKTKSNKILITSIRNPAEIEELKKNDKFFLILIDAPIELRYKRLKIRKRAEDFVSFKKFKIQEKVEMSSKDESNQQLNKVFALADFKIINDGTIEELYQKIEEIFKKING